MHARVASLASVRVPRIARRVGAGAWCLSVASVSEVASAQTSRASSPSGLEIVLGDGRSWDAALREIQVSPATAGRTYEVGVRSRGTTVRCSEYDLSLDPAAGHAFENDGCDTATGMTHLRLIDRSALFAPGDVVPIPRTATIHAALRQSATAHGGGEEPTAGSKIWCSVALQPYLWDGLHGVTVPLPPDRFELRPLEEHIHAAPDGSGWIARGESHMAIRFHYDVLDRATGEKVLEDVATLACADQPAAPTPKVEFAPLTRLFPAFPPIPPIDLSLPAPHASLRTPGLVVIGIGSAGLVAAGVLGIVALNEKAILDSECPTRTTCPIGLQSNINALGAYSLASDAALAIGATAVVTGIVLLAIHPKDPPTSAGYHTHVHVDPWLGVGSAGLRGTF